ncbi:MAG TPA: DUF983 domain-containing protein [Allosphingosinicella sp.]|nr:DUF983 domain-containing protein [Allosphingosinicella sp.]
MNSTPPPPAPSECGSGALADAAQGLCPRCREGTLFAGPVQFAPACRACGLDFAGFNVGDGPAAFLIFGVGGLITALAIWLELRASPPWWLHLLLWLPLAIILTIGGLRVAKAWLLTIEYRRSAREAGHRDTR